jgi:hypothetical protein
MYHSAATHGRVACSARSTQRIVVYVVLLTRELETIDLEA